MPPARPSPPPASPFAHITLEQWRALIAVVDSGGYAQAAGALHKSQSSITYAVQKIETQLNLKIFAIQGRRAVLTEAGEVLQRRARTLVAEALALERGAVAMAADWKPELRIAVEAIFPTWLLLECLRDFAQERPETHIELYETVLGGTDEALAQGTVDLAITSRIPQGRAARALLRLRFVPVARPDHPLHRLGRPLTMRDLRRHRHLFIRDSGSQRGTHNAWQGEELRWTVSYKATLIRALLMGLGFAWVPEHSIRTELEAGALQPLPMRDSDERWVQLYLAFADPDYVDRDTDRLARIIHARVAGECREAVQLQTGASAGTPLKRAADKTRADMRSNPDASRTGSRTKARNKKSSEKRT